MDNFLRTILLNISVDPSEGVAECYPSKYMVVFRPTVLLDEWAAFDCFQFVIPLTQFPPIIVEKSVIQLLPFQVFPINPGQKHRAENFALQQSYLAIFLSAELLRSLSLKIYGKPVREFGGRPRHIAASLLPLIKNFMRESLDKSPGYPLVQEALSIQVATVLLRGIGNDCRIGELPTGSNEERLAQAVEFLETCYDEKISLQNLANLANMSRYHFLRSFRNYTGKTPYQYLTDIRIGRVKELLGASELTITEACNLCGFDYGNHFSALFKRLTGHSPREYRRLERMRRQDAEGIQQ